MRNKRRWRASCFAAPMAVATGAMAIAAGPCSAEPTEGAAWRVNFAGSGGRALPAAGPGLKPGRLDNPHPGALCFAAPPSATFLAGERSAAHDHGYRLWCPRAGTRMVRHHHVEARGFSGCTAVAEEHIAGGEIGLGELTDGLPLGACQGNKTVRGIADLENQLRGGIVRVERVEVFQFNPHRATAVDAN